MWGTVGCPHRDRELEGTLKLHEFLREAEELQSWLASQKQTARGESLGEDHEQVLVRKGLGQGGTPEAEPWGEGAQPGWAVWRRGLWEPRALAEDRPSE